MSDFVGHPRCCLQYFNKNLIFALVEINYSEYDKRISNFLFICDRLLFGL